MMFSEQLKAWRVFRDLTQSELARRTKIPRPNIVNLEKGHRDCTLETLSRLAKALAITPGQLLDKIPSEIESLNRFEVDELAKSFLTDKPKLSKKLHIYYQILAPTVFPSLRALKLLHWKQLAKRKSVFRHQPTHKWIDPKLRQQIYRRFNKYAANQL